MVAFKNKTEIQKVDASQIVTRWIPVEDIEDHPDNFNNHPSSQVKQLGVSHEEIGQYRSIVVWARPGGKYVRVTGHGYSAGAQSKGETVLRAEVLPEDTSPDTVQAIMLADNLHARNSVSDDEKLGHILQRQRERGVRLAALGTDEEAVRQLLKSVENSHATDFLKPLLTTPAVGLTSSLLPAPTSVYEERHEGEEMAAQTRVFQESGNQHSSDSESSAADMLSATYVSFMVSVTLDQRQTILAAIKKAQQRWQLETSQNALTAICQQFLAAA